MEASIHTILKRMARMRSHLNPVNSLKTRRIFRKPRDCSFSAQHWSPSCILVHRAAGRNHGIRAGAAARGFSRGAVSSRSAVGKVVHDHQERRGDPRSLVAPCDILRWITQYVMRCQSLRMCSSTSRRTVFSTLIV